MLRRHHKARANATSLIQGHSKSKTNTAESSRASRLWNQLRRYGRDFPIPVPAMRCVATLRRPDTRPARCFQPPVPTTVRQRLRQMLQFRNTAMTGMLRQLNIRAASAAFRIPNTDGFMGLPLLETQKADPKDVGSFWKKHDPPLGRSKDFWTTEEGRSLMTEWDNGTNFTPNVRAVPNMQQSEAFPLNRLQQEVLY